MNAKKYIGLISLIGGVLCGCSGDRDDYDPGRSDGRVVRLHTGITPHSRAAVSGFNGQTVAFAKADASNAYTEVWDAVARQGEAQLTGEHLYPEDRSYIYLRGFYPPGGLTQGTVLYDLDGQTDIMATTEQRGSMTDNFSLVDKTFYFTHLLTQVHFAIRLSEASAASVRLCRLTLAGSRRQVSLNLAASAANTLPALSFAGAASPLSVYVEPHRGEGIILKNEEQSLPQQLLVEPAASLTLDIEVGYSDTETKIYTGLPVHFDEEDGASVPGTAYRILITLNPPGGLSEPGISLGVSVAPWLSGTGEGTVN